MERFALTCLLLAAACVPAPAPAPEPQVPWPLPASVRTRPQPAPGPDTGPRIVLHAPPSPTGEEAAYLAGWALGPDALLPRLDVVLALDVSGSTGRDVTEKDTGLTLPLPYLQRFAPLERSILGAELEAARALLEVLEPDLARVGIVVFSGMPEGRRIRNPALTMVPLTRDHELVRGVLEVIGRDGPHGMTHMAAGLELAVAELVGGPGASSEPSRDATRVVLLLSDGAPTLPREGFPEYNERRVVEAAQRAASYGVRVHSFGVGAEALEGPFALVEMARLTGGEFVPVRDPGQLPELLPLVPLTGMRDLRVRNLTTGAGALAARLETSGRFHALVPLAPGTNRVEIRARSRDGTEARRVVMLERVAGPVVEPPPLAEPWATGRAELADAVALERAEQRRLELLGQLRAEMEEARRRAAERRKELELEVEEGPP